MASEASSSTAPFVSGDDTSEPLAQDPSASSAINFLTLCTKLKTTKRTGWLQHHVHEPESIADHMYRMGLMALIFPDIPGVDRNKCIKMAIVHDVAEAVVGDITRSQRILREEQIRMEREALQDMCNRILGGGPRAEEILQLWEEFEERSSIEAKLVKDLDWLEGILQALEYEKAEGMDLSHYLHAYDGMFQTDIGKSWALEIISRSASNNGPGVSAYQRRYARYDEVHDSFDAMSLQENLLRGIQEQGFERPTEFQQRGIVPLCRELDIIEQAGPGTGKTTALCIAILQRLDYNLLKCQALVLAPTHELAQHIEKVMVNLGRYLPAKICSCVGSTSVRRDQMSLKCGVHVVVGTPGRVEYLLKDGDLKPGNIKIFALDRAHALLDGGKDFKEQINRITSYFPQKPQVCVSGGTLSLPSQDYIRQYMNNPVKIHVRT